MLQVGRMIAHLLCSQYLHLFQSNEVGGAVYCEKEGLARSLDYLKKAGLTVDVIVTDRHPQITKYLREQHKEITQYYDIWHVSKGLHFQFTLESS